VTDQVIPQPPADSTDVTVQPDPSQAPAVPTSVDTSGLVSVDTSSTPTVTPPPSTPEVPQPSKTSTTVAPSFFKGEVVARDYDDTYSDTGRSTQIGIIVNTVDGAHQISWLQEASGFIPESELRAL
jgi:hypothetical protein